jgi:hypothetical protein
MKNSNLNTSTFNIYEKECRRLWQDISQKIYQPIEYDINSTVFEINYSVKSGHYSFVRKDFSIFDLDHYKFFDRININIDSTSISVTPIDLAKLVFLSLVQGRKPSSGYISGVFNGVSSFFALMRGKPIDAQLGEPDYEEYYETILSFIPTIEGLEKRLSAPSYGTAEASLNLSVAIKTYRSLGVPFTFSNLSKGTERELLNKVCLNVMGLTLQDYERAGSFNFLGLDVGKHYIDHCANVFEDNYQFAVALRKTHTNTERILKSIRLPERENSKSVLIGRTLTGAGVDAISAATGLSRSRIEIPHNLLLDEFRKQYNDCSILSSINSYEVISQIIQHASLPERFDTYEFVRSILIAEFVNDWNKPSEAIFLEYAAALKVDNSFLDKKNAIICTYEEFIDICLKSVKVNSKTLPKGSDKLSEFIKSQFSKATFVSDSLVGSDALNRLCFGVESAGSTLFIALTGWRRSEFGFPISSVTATINTEVLDNLYTPWRFNVSWYVPKSHRDAKLNREITSYAYQIAYMASLLNLSLNEKPALYKPQLKDRTDRAVAFKSGQFLDVRVDFLWLDFVENYTLFSSLDISEYPEINELKSSLCEAIPVYEFWRDPNKSKTLKHYREGSLDEKTTKLLDNKLSDETREFVKDVNNSMNLSTIISVSRELMSNLPYPTPHAFRHIWAEAVLTRYRGDIGKVLRANFKHMDERFFAAYLRNKEMNAVYRIAERTIINQIVRQHIRSADNEYQDYSGGFQRYVAKAARMTKVVTTKEREQLVDKIDIKVIGVKTTRWATCMLRSSNQHRAKCSVDGIPQRRNAAPEFCLSCMHADISEMNFKGIVLSIKDDVMACRNDNLPEFIKAQHIKVLKVALVRVRELKENSGKTDFDKYIDHLQESIDMAVATSLLGSKKND